MITAPLRDNPTASRAAWRLAFNLATLLLLATAAAHGMLVLGAVSLSPDPPVPDQPVTITVDLATSGGAPVEGAKLAGEIRPANAPGADPVTLSFKEYPEPYGTYRAQIAAPSAGSYSLTVIDHTYAKEHVTASVTVHVGPTAPNGALDFTFPPTSGPRSITTWLLWLVGLPLAVGVLVTILVLRSKAREESAEEGAAP